MMESMDQPISASAPQPGPLPYHRQLRAQPRYRWWRPLLALGVLLVGWLLLQLLLVPIVEAAAAAGWRFETGSDGTILFDAVDPIGMALLLGSVILLLPLAWLALRISGLGRLGVLSSVEGRLRWGWLLRCIWPAIGAFVLMVLAGMVLGLLAGVADPAALPDPDAPPPTLTAGPVFLAAAAVIVLLVPLQAAAEEYLFRGLGVQLFGSWIRPAAVAALPALLAFTAGHLYDLWGLLQVALLGVGFAWVTWRSGGLEAAIVLHTVNNLVAMLLQASGLLGETTGVASGSGSPAALLPNAVMVLVFCAWVHRRSPVPWPALPPPHP